MPEQALHIPHKSEQKIDHFLVCGLGSLGQHCVRTLRRFHVGVSAIELSPNPDWQAPQDPSLLTTLHIGDCRQSELLSEAQVEQCRAIFLVTNDEQVNLDTAFAARLLNPTIRIVVRSSKKNLNNLLEHQLGNFVAFEPTELSAPAFALAALNPKNDLVDRDVIHENSIIGFFSIDHELFHVVKHTVHRDDHWCGRFQLYELNNRLRKVLADQPPEGNAPFKEFYNWHPSTRVEEGHSLITIERSYSTKPLRASPRQDYQTFIFYLVALIRYPPKLSRQFKKALLDVWDGTESNQIQRVAIICFVTVICLWGIGTLLFSLYFPEISLIDAFYAVAILLLGGFGDLFGELSSNIRIPWWLRLFSFGLTLAGTAFIGVIYALLIEKLLSWRLRFTESSSPLPKKEHIIIIGLGRVGKRVALLLQELRQYVVGLAGDFDCQINHIPIIEGNYLSSLNKSYLNSAKSVVAVTNNELENLELSLFAHSINPDCRLVIRTYEQRFSDRVAQLFPYAHVLCAAAISAEAFVAAAFGENVLSLFRIEQETILVTEFTIETNDTLNGLILADVAYGYGVVPIFHKRPEESLPTYMPSDDLELRNGDRLFVLATIDSLQRVESSQLRQPSCYIYINKVFTKEALFNGANELSRVSGCDLKTARESMNHIPGKFPIPMYVHQAHRLVKRLKSLRILAHLVYNDSDYSRVSAN